MAGRLQIIMRVNDVVQFNETHEWCGCLGIIDKINGARIMVGVPMPESRYSLYILQRIGNRIYR